MSLFWTIFLVWFLGGVGAAALLIRRGPWTLFWGALLLTLYGGVAAIETLHRGALLENSEFDLAGHSLLLFFSVLGGALISTALGEIRHARNKA